MADPLWFKVSPELLRHSKTQLLCHLIDDPRAWAYVVQMWAWFVEHEGSGRVSGQYATVQIARGCGWMGDPDVFCQHLVACGFLDRDGEGLAVHDWEEWAGFHILSRARAAEKKRGQRKRPAPVPLSVPGTSEGQGGDMEAKESGSERISGGHLSTLNSVVSSSSSLERPRLPTRDELHDRTHPLSAELLAWLRDRGVWLAHADKPAARHATEANVARDGVAIVGERVRLAYAVKPGPTLGWFLDDMAAPKPKDIRTGSAAPADHSAFGKGGIRAIE